MTFCLSHVHFPFRFYICFSFFEIHGLYMLRLFCVWDVSVVPPPTQTIPWPCFTPDASGRTSHVTSPQNSRRSWQTWESATHSILQEQSRPPNQVHIHFLPEIRLLYLCEMFFRLSDLLIPFTFPPRNGQGRGVSTFETTQRSLLCAACQSIVQRQHGIDRMTEIHLLLSGVRHGLTLLLNIEQYEHMSGTQLVAGAKVGICFLAGLRQPASAHGQKIGNICLLKGFLVPSICVWCVSDPTPWPWRCSSDVTAGICCCTRQQYTGSCPQTGGQ